MTLQGPEFKKAALLGLMVATLPMFLYPRGFGIPDATVGSPMLFLFEPFYYALLFYLTIPRRTPQRIIGLTVVGMGFRLFVGLISSALLSAIFGLPAAKAFSTSLYTYLPGALAQIVFIPFIVKPILSFKPRRRPAPVHHEAPRIERTAPERKPAVETSTWSASQENLPDFDAAVNHIASYSTVELAVLVDREGLPLARAGRPTADWELWAPVVNRLHDTISAELGRTGKGGVHRFDLALDEHRLSVITVEPFFLSVLYDPSTDDLVNVRIAQAVEMVKRYREHKYPQAVTPVASEVAYV